MSKQANIDLIREALRARGIVNETLINAILAVVGKESFFTPQSENLNYSAERITQVWPYIKINEARELANNPVKLAERVYSKKYGNIKAGDAYAYRGRGFNQVTFADNYYSLSKKLGIDLIKNPDLLNDPKIAAAALAEYYRQAFASGAKFIKDFYKININALQPGIDPLTLLKIAVNANSGWRKDRAIVEKEYLKALPFFEKFMILKGSPITAAKNSLPVLIPLIFLLLFLIKQK